MVGLIHAESFCRRDYHRYRECPLPRHANQFLQARWFFRKFCAGCALLCMAWLYCSSSAEFRGLGFDCWLRAESWGLPTCADLPGKPGSNLFVSHDKMLFNMDERTGNIWMAERKER